MNNEKLITELQAENSRVNELLTLEKKENSDLQKSMKKTCDQLEADLVAREVELKDLKSEIKKLKVIEKPFIPVEAVAVDGDDRGGVMKILFPRK